MKSFVSKVLIVTLAVMLVGFVLIKTFHWELSRAYLVSWNNPPNKELRQKMKWESKIVTESFGNKGSGCEPVKGFTFTARHIVLNHIADLAHRNKAPEGEISVNGQKAHIYGYTPAGFDFVILSTKPKGEKLPLDLVNFSRTELEEGQILYTFGSSGSITEFAQELQIIKIQFDANNKPIELIVKGSVAEAGISGSCVIDEFGGFVGIIKATPPDNFPRHIAIASVINSDTIKYWITGE